MAHLLVTNDFPPKVGGIQSYLWELWRRMPEGEAVVFTAAFEGAPEWDRDQPFAVVRSKRASLLPMPGTAVEIMRVAEQVRPDLLLFDPALPLGAIAPAISRATGVPYGVVLHGAEVTIPGRMPATRQLLSRTLRQARIAICAGGYSAVEARRAAGARVPTLVIPPGVDVKRFLPGRDAVDRDAVRRRLGLPVDADLVLGVSRLVPRKGFDVVLRAAASLKARHPRLHVVIAGVGRDRERLDRTASRVGAPVTFMGRVVDDDLPDLYACSDIFAMVCRERWLGLEQEGFGIVFLEAAACGVAAVAGRSGGAHEAVVDEATGVVVRHPESVPQTACAIARLLDHPEWRRELGAAARRRVEAGFDYDLLADRLLDGLRRAQQSDHARSQA